MIRGNKPIEYGKDFMKIKSESVDDFPLGKILSIHVCIITVGSVFQEHNNYDPQVHLHECLYEHEYKDDNFQKIDPNLLSINKEVKLLTSFIH